MAISFLIQCFTSLDEGLLDDRAAICQSLITDCIRLLSIPDQSAQRINRVVEILKQTVLESEKKGIDV